MLRVFVYNETMQLLVNGSANKEEETTTKRLRKSDWKQCLQTKFKGVVHREGYLGSPCDAFLHSFRVLVPDGSKVELVTETID